MDFSIGHGGQSLANLGAVAPTDHDHEVTRPTQDASHPRGQILRRLSGVPVIVLIAIALGGCRLPTFGAFRGATKQGQTEFTLWSWLVMLGLAVAIIVWGLIFWSRVRYRRRDDKIPRQFHENIPIEIIYTVIPVLLVGVIFYATVVSENKIDAIKAKPAEIINVTAYRWGWRFAYENSSGASQNVLIQTKAEPSLAALPATSSEYPQLVLPDNATVRIVLQSSDVIHGFYIPAFNFSRYAQPGVVNEFDFTPTTTGVFRGQCAQYCGLYHSEMLFSVRVVSQSDFATWLSASHS